MGTQDRYQRELTEGIRTKKGKDKEKGENKLRETILMNLRMSTLTHTRCTKQ